MNSNEERDSNSVAEIEISFNADFAVFRSVLLNPFHIPHNLLHP